MNKHSCPNCLGVDPDSCMYAASGTDPEAALAPFHSLMREKEEALSLLHREAELIFATHIAPSIQTKEEARALAKRLPPAFRGYARRLRDQLPWGTPPPPKSETEEDFDGE